MEYAQAGRESFNHEYFLEHHKSLIGWLSKKHGLLYGLQVELPYACMLAAIAARDRDGAKLKAAEEEIDPIRSKMLGWGRVRRGRGSQRAAGDLQGHGQGG